MSLTSSNSDSGISGNENSIPKFPERREKYLDWKMVMSAYLDARGLLEIATGEASSEEEDSDSKKSSSSSSSSSLSSFNEKSKRVYALLLQSFRDKQMLFAQQVKPGDAAALWKKLNDTYGIIKTTDTKMSILYQLQNIRKFTGEEAILGPGY